MSLMEHNMPTDRNAVRRFNADTRGFSLVELLVVVSIIALLVGILIPVLGSVRNSAKKTQATTLLNDVANASSMFLTDNRRLPGYWSQDDLGSAENQASNGVSNTHSVLLDLAGGINPDAPAPSISPTDAGYSVVEIGPRGTTAPAAVRIDNRQVGTGKFGGGYLKLGAEVLYCVPNALRTGSMQNNNGNPDYPGIVDLVDPFGMPVLIYSENESAQSVPGARFSARRAPQTPGEPVAKFYWATNSIYTSSTALGEAGVRIAGANGQQGLSLLGSDMTDDKLDRTMEGVLGSPAFPQKPDPSLNVGTLVPAAGRGKLVLISAGADKVYVARKQDRFRPTTPGVDGQVWYAPLRTQGDPSSSDTTLGTLSEFDDVVIGAGQ